MRFPLFQPAFVRNLHVLNLGILRFIEDRYGAINVTKYGHFDAKLLNDSAAEVNATISGGPVAKGFMFASLVAFNATEGSGIPNSGTTNTNNTQKNDNGPNTSLAM